MKCLAILAMASVVAQCGEKRDDCLNLAVSPAAGQVDARQSMTACVDRWASLYAKGPDSLPVVADAAVQKCDVDLQLDNLEAAKASGVTNDYAASRDEWVRYAKTVVAEARARMCYN